MGRSRLEELRNQQENIGASLVAQMVKKNSTCNEGDLGWTLVSGRSPGEGICNPLQYSCLENPKDREAWQATVHRVTELNMTERLSTAQENMQLVEKGKCA